MTPSDHDGPRRAAVRGAITTGRSDFEPVLRLEFLGTADAWLDRHPDSLGLSYGYVLFAVVREGETTARSA